MAEAAFNASPPVGWVATSAGTEPAATPNPRTEGMLREIGLPLPRHGPQLLTDEQMTGASVRVTMGCLDRASCPTKLRTFDLVDWDLPDPAKLDDAGFRHVRDLLVERVDDLRRELTAQDRRPRELPASQRHERRD